MQTAINQAILSTATAADTIARSVSTATELIRETEARALADLSGPVLDLARAVASVKASLARVRNEALEILASLDDFCGALQHDVQAPARLPVPEPAPALPLPPVEAILRANPDGTVSALTPEQFEAELGVASPPAPEEPDPAYHCPVCNAPISEDDYGRPFCPACDGAPEVHEPVQVAALPPALPAPAPVASRVCPDCGGPPGSGRAVGFQGHVEGCCEACVARRLLALSAEPAPAPVAVPEPAPKAKRDRRKK